MGKKIDIPDDEHFTSKIGTIQFSTNLDKCDIEIDTSNSDIAHFHIRNKEKKIDISIQLYNNEYYGENTIYLNDIEKRELIGFLEREEELPFYNQTNYIHLQST